MFFVVIETIAHGFNKGLIFAERLRPRKVHTTEISQYLEV